MQKNIKVDFETVEVLVAQRIKQEKMNDFGYFAMKLAAMACPKEMPPSPCGI